MHVVYVPINDQFWSSYYLAQAKQTGHGLSGFEGIPYQRGHGLGSFFRGLLRMIVPVAKTVGKSAIKAIGKEALSAGANIAGDLVRGRDLKQTVKEHGRNAAGNLLTKAGTKLQTGGKLGKRPTKRKAKPVASVVKRKRMKRSSLFDTD